MSTEIILIENINPREVFGKERGLDHIIEKIKEKVKSEVIDISTEEGRRHVGSLAKKIGSTKVALQNMALELTEDWRSKTNAVNAEKKRMSDELDALRDEIKAPLDAFKERERLRVEEREQRIEAIKSLLLNETNGVIRSAEWSDRIVRIEELKVFDWQEFENRANTTFDMVLVSLQHNFLLSQKQEQDQAELERLKKEQVERETKEREQIIAETARKEAEEKAERDRIEAECKAKEAIEAAERKAADAAKVERNRMEAEKKAEADAAAAREADQKHRSSVNNAALAAIVKESGISEDAAKMVIVAIAKGQIPNVKIIY